METGGNLCVDMLNGGFIVNMQSQGKAKDGYFHETPEGNRYIVNEVKVTPTEPSGKMTITKYKITLPMSNTELQLHQFVLGTGHHYGININLDCHYVTGGILSGVLSEGETVDEKFNCIPNHPESDTLLAQGLVPNPSQRCDGDHLFGRDSKYLNGLLYVQGVPHRENGIRGYVRKDLGEWLFPLLVGKYTRGNDMPNEFTLCL